MLIATNRKGGVGKTTIASNIASIYGQDRRVLLLDFDPQGDASACLGVDSTGEDLAAVLTGRGVLEAAVVPTPWNVDVAPGGEALGYVSDSVSPGAVARLVDSARDLRYEQILIDCPPGLNSLVAATWNAVPTAVAIVPVDGMKALRAVNRMRNAWMDYGLDPARMRVVLSRHDGRRILDREVERQARLLYGDAVLTARIRDTVVVGESAAWRRPMVDYAYGHPATQDMVRLAEEVQDA